MKYYTIAEFAKIINVIPNTLRVWDRQGKLKPIKLASGHRRYTDEHLNQLRNDVVKSQVRQTVIYARESTKQQKTSLESQIDTLKTYCIANGIAIDKVYSDFGSGLNYNRTEFQNLVEDICHNKIDKVIVFYKDRLMRFGFELFEHLCKLFGTKIIVVDNSESNKSKEMEFADDLISIIHDFSMKLYGSRSYKKKIEQAEKCINNIKNDLDNQ